MRPDRATPGRAWRRCRPSSALGVRIAIDDFGTGYSSLSYLRRLPVRRAQDRPLVHRGYRDVAPGCGPGPLDREIGQTLHLETVAEGVETEEQVDRLVRLGCQARPGLPVRASIGCRGPCDAAPCRGVGRGLTRKRDATQVLAGVGRAYRPGPTMAGNSTEGSHARPTRTPRHRHQQALHPTRRPGPVHDRPGGCRPILAADQRQAAKATAKPGQGDRGDRKKS